MIENLLEVRQILFQIAEELYGDLWVMEEKFWGSPTERELNLIQQKLFDFGWEEATTPEQEEIAKEIAKKFGLDLDL